MYNAYTVFFYAQIVQLLLESRYNNSHRMQNKCRENQNQRNTPNYVKDYSDRNGGLKFKQNTSECNVICSVPQGSALGPTLFLVYINDLHDIKVENAKAYADDTDVFFLENYWDEGRIIVVQETAHIICE